MRGAFNHRAVAGHELTGTHQQLVTRCDLGRSDIHDVSIDDAVGESGCVSFKRLHRAAGARDRVRFQCFTTGLHEHDHQTGERLAQCNCTNNGEHGDNIGREIAAQHLTKGAPRHRHPADDKAHEPDAVTPGGPGRD